MTTLQAKHYDAIRAAREMDDLQKGIDGDSEFSKSYQSAKLRLYNQYGVAIARALLDAIEELERTAK